MIQVLTKRDPTVAVSHNRLGLGVRAAVRRIAPSPAAYLGVRDAVKDIQ